MTKLGSILFCLVLCSSPAAAQREGTLPEECKYCKGNPTSMQRAGIVSHGPFPFGQGDTQSAEALLPLADIFWIESAHFRLGFGAGPAKVNSKQTRKVREELQRLEQVLPAVQPKTKLLDPWLRTHLFAQRFEEAYTEFLQLMQVQESDFPDSKQEWLIGAPYWGEGPYLGQKDKYEVLVLINSDQQVDYLSDQFGLQVQHSQKWNILARGALTLVTNVVEDGLQDDTKLHGHLIFNLVHNFIDGFKYYSYDTPLWLQEGLGHYFERRVSTRFNSYSRSEGGAPVERGTSNWIAKLKMLIAGNKAPRLAELMGLKAFADFRLEDHYTSWSMIAFLIESRPKAFAELNKLIHGRKRADGTPDGENIDDVFRDAFKQTVMLSYASFDREWTEWALDLED